MKKIQLLGIGLLLCSVLAFAAPTDNSWDGWISDSKCGAKGANADHAACAKGCISKGEKPVFVSDTDQQVINIDNPKSVAGHEGQHVKVTGTMKNGTLHVDKVAQI